MHESNAIRTTYLRVQPFAPAHESPERTRTRLAAPSPREGRAGRGLGRGVRTLSNHSVGDPLSLALSPLFRRGEREFAPAITIAHPACIPNQWRCLEEIAAIANQIPVAGETPEL